MLLFIATYYGAFSFWQWNPSLRCLVWAWDSLLFTGTFTAKIFLLFVIHHNVYVGPAYSVSLLLPRVLLWLLLYIHLAFKWLLIMIIL